MKTHWKKLTNPDYLGAYDFQPGEVRLLTINGLERKMVMGPNNREEECTICYWQEHCKPMILNNTNSKAIEKVAGTPYLEDWHGTRVYVVVERIKAFGEMVDALRIKSEKPKDKRPTLTESGLQSAIEAIQAGKTTLADVLEKRQMTEEIMARLIEAIEPEPTSEAPSDPNA
jgi:hypothetical protein